MKHLFYYCFLCVFCLTMFYVLCGSRKIPSVGEGGTNVFLFTCNHHTSQRVWTNPEEGDSVKGKGNKVRKRANIRNRYNQAPHLTHDTNGKVTTSQLDITNEISPFISIVISHMSRDMRFPAMWYVRPAKPQISLRIRAD